MLAKKQLSSFFIISNMHAAKNALATTLFIVGILVPFLFAPTLTFADSPRSASVSATVLPTPENTRPKRQKNFFEKLDPYQQLTVGSGVGLGILTLGAGTLFALQHRKKRQST